MGAVTSPFNNADPFLYFNISKSEEHFSKQGRIPLIRLDIFLSNPHILICTKLVRSGFSVNELDFAIAYADKILFPVDGDYSFQELLEPYPVSKNINTYILCNYDAKSVLHTHTDPPGVNSVVEAGREIGIVDQIIVHLDAIDNNIKLAMIVALFCTMKRAGDWGLTHYCKRSDKNLALITGDRPHSIYAKMMGVPVIYNPSNIDMDLLKGAIGISSYFVEDRNNISNITTQLNELKKIIRITLLDIPDLPNFDLELTAYLSNSDHWEEFFGLINIHFPVYNRNADGQLVLPQPVHLFDPKYFNDGVISKIHAYLMGRQHLNPGIMENLMTFYISPDGNNNPQRDRVLAHYNIDNSRSIFEYLIEDIISNINFVLGTADGLLEQIKIIWRNCIKNTKKLTVDTIRNIIDKEDNKRCRNSSRKKNAISDTFSGNDKMIKSIISDILPRLLDVINTSFFLENCKKVLGIYHIVNNSKPRLVDIPVIPNIQVICINLRHFKEQLNRLENDLINSLSDNEALAEHLGDGPKSKLSNQLSNLCTSERRTIDECIALLQCPHAPVV